MQLNCWPMNFRLECTGCVAESAADTWAGHTAAVRPDSAGLLEPVHCSGWAAATAVCRSAGFTGWCRFESAVHDRQP